MTDARHVADALARAYAGGPERHREKSLQQGKLPVRERVARLVDEGSFSEDALLANWEADGLGADGVVTGMGTVGGRTVALMANDPTVKAGSWGPKTVEKILRIQEAALAHRVPMVYLVDSAGARIGEKVSLEEMGGAKMHTSASGCGHFLVDSDEEGIDLAKRYLGYFPTHCDDE